MARWEDLTEEQRQWVKDKLREREATTFPADGTPYHPTPQLQMYKDLLIQRAIEDRDSNGPEKWHDTLTRYTELEKRVAWLEHQIRVLEGTLANFMGRFANKA